MWHAICDENLAGGKVRPGLNGALFVKHRGTKKREWKTEKDAKKSLFPYFWKMNLSPRTVTVMRYILPLREGGSLPALAEADDDFKYVLKFRGAGHGVKMLISELLGGLIAKKVRAEYPRTCVCESGCRFSDARKPTRKFRIYWSFLRV